MHSLSDWHEAVAGRLRSRLATLLGAGLGGLPACLLAMTGLVWSGTARAQFEIVPLAELQLEHSVNEAVDPPDTFRSDLVRLLVGFEADWLVSRQQLFLDAKYGSVSYDGLPDFGDDEYEFRGGMNWLLRDRLDGLLEALDQKRVPSFTDVLLKGNTVEEERRLTGTLNAQLLRRLRLETAAISRNLDTPIVDIRDFGLRETINQAGLRLQVAQRVSLGGEYENIDGNFRNAAGLGAYTQTTPAVFLDYQETDLQTLRFKLGWTERDQEGEPEPYEETTGAFSVERALSGKTSVNAQGSRDIDNYFGADAGAFALVDSWNVGITWQATGKSSLYLDYGQSRTEFLGDGVAGTAVTGRVDRSSAVNLSLENDTYAWLLTEIYVRLDDVNSNIDRYTYDGFVIGVKFEARLLQTEPR